MSGVKLIELVRLRADVWRYATLVLLSELRKLRERGRVSQREYDEITSKALRECLWGSNACTLAEADAESGSVDRG